MYCKHCGKQLPDFSKFCRFCGTDLRGLTAENTISIQPTQTITTQTLTTNQTQTFTVPVQQPVQTTGSIPVQQPVLTKKKSNPVVLVALIAFLLLAGLSAAYFLFFNRKSINPKDFVTVEMTDSLNGSASAYVDIDYDKLNNLIGKKNLKNAVKKMLSDQEKESIQYFYNMTVDEFLDSSLGGQMLLDARHFLYAYADNTRNLSNGDEILINFESSGYSMELDDVCKLLNIKLPKEYRYKVSGLSEGKTVDIMLPDLEKYIVFYGTNGAASIAAQWDGIKYRIDNTYDVTMNGQWGVVSKDGMNVGNIIYTFALENSNHSIDALSQGDRVFISATADDSLVQEFAGNGLTASNNKQLIVVNELGTSLDTSTLSNDQLRKLGEQVVITARNHELEKCPILVGLYSYKNGSQDGLAYVFRTTSNEYYAYTQDIYTSADGNDIISSSPSYLHLANADDIKNELRGYQLQPLNGDVINDAKYVVGKEVKVMVKGLRVRSGPGTNTTHVKNNGVLMNYEEGEYLKVIDEVRDSSNNIWYEVQFTRNGQQFTYWASGGHVEIQ